MAVREAVPEEPIPEGGIGLEELTELALAAVDQPHDPAAGPDPFLRHRGPLPATYMPDASPGPHRAWVSTVAAFLVTLFLVATALGYCLTDGVALH